MENGSLLNPIEQSPGNPNVDLGLDDVTMMYAARRIMEAADRPDVVFVEPRDVMQWIELPEKLAIDHIGQALSHFDGCRLIALCGSHGHGAVFDYVMTPCGGEHQESSGEGLRASGLSHPFRL